MILEPIADDLDMRTSDRIRAIDLLAKYGLGSVQEISLSDVRDRLIGTIAAIKDQLEEEDAFALVAKISPIWK